MMTVSQGSLDLLEIFKVGIGKDRQASYNSRENAEADVSVCTMNSGESPRALVWPNKRACWGWGWGSLSSSAILERGVAGSTCSHLLILPLTN